MPRRWITCILAAALLAGKSGVGESQPTPAVLAERKITDAETSHWSYQPVRKPPIPTVTNRAWLRTAIDAFILAKLEADGIQPTREADRRKLLRRVYMDLIGLTPTSDELYAFLSDNTPNAFDKVVDELLARPQFGERWARHWLDVARFAESNGYERDGAKPHAWRYRDYVINACNKDKPYDRFVVEQIAGDELDGSNAESQIATTFLRLATWDDEPADPLHDRYDQLDEIVASIGLTFLGLTIQCARCHDHKFEPLTQFDYARLLSVFEPLQRPQDNRRDLDRLVGTPVELDRYRRAKICADAAATPWRQKIKTLELAVRDRLFKDNRTKLPADAIRAFQTEAGKRSEKQKTLVKDFREKLAKEILEALTREQQSQLTLWRSEVTRILPPEPPRAYVWFENGPVAPESHVFVRGNPARKAAKVVPGIPAVFQRYQQNKAVIPTAHSSGRRRWLANWIVADDNPLTARVWANRVWQHYFGDGIVRTENDFGLIGERPSHPELLDWLAASLRESGWSSKTIHRLIVLSAAYRMASTGNAAAAEKDPAERLLWRFRPRRLDAEAFRDSVLAISGSINLEMTGPSIYPHIEQAVLDGQSRPGDGWTASPAVKATRRSIYIFVKRSLMVPEMELLDSPNGATSCEQRPNSTVAPQALTLFNGRFMNEQAERMAARIIRDVGPIRKSQVDRAFELVFCRKPTLTEWTAVDGFLDACNNAQSNSPITPVELGRSRDTLRALCLVLLNSNEAIYCD